MKKIFFLLTAIVSVLSLQNSTAQLKMPQASSSQTIIQEFGLGKVTVKYSRPNIKGRSVEKDLAPFAEVWRTGANDATLITFTDEVSLEGNKVPAGEYAIFTIPGKDEWTIILNKETKQWGSYQYKQSEDFLRFKVKPSKTTEKSETFSINFSNVMPSSANIDLVWDNFKVSAKMTVDVDSKIMAGIDEAMKSDKKPYYPAAVYYFENGKDLKKALEWISMAEAGDQKAPWFKYQKARIQLKSGDKAGAAKTAAAGIEAAKAVNNVEYIRLNQNILSEASR
jgi:predicted transcriptional regulator YdeE